MKRRTLCLVLLISLMAGWSGLVGAADKPRTTLTGEIIDLTTFAMKADAAERDAEAMGYRVEGGFPVGLLTDDGEVYIAVYRNPAPAAGLETANKILRPLVGKQVVCQGRVFENGPVKVVEIAIVSEM
jgi:hypothetical protein